jgi:hypothetical protein
MDAWAIDHVEAEPGVIAFLNERAGLHRVVRPTVVSGAGTDVTDRLQAITQQTSRNINSKRLMDADIRSWATANEINRATRSLYGSSRRNPAERPGHSTRRWTRRRSGSATRRSRGSNWRRMRSRRRWRRSVNRWTLSAEGPRRGKEKRYVVLMPNFEKHAIGF